jgi:hypothetical protein
MPLATRLYGPGISGYLGRLQCNYTLSQPGEEIAGPWAPLLQQVREFCHGGWTEAAVTLCQNPPYWHTTLAQLMAVALRNRDKGIAKIKQILVMEFHTEVIAGMENRLADMMSMVDLLFQLMTFMLFSVQMTGGEKVEVPSARHGVGVEESAAMFLILLKPAAPGAEPWLLLDHGKGPSAILDQVRKAVAEGVREGRRKVVLQVDGAASRSPPRSPR